MSVPYSNSDIVSKSNANTMPPFISTATDVTSRETFNDNHTHDLYPDSAPKYALRADNTEKGLVIARYDYQATDMHELSMQRNERLRLLDDAQHWWCVMNSEGRVGYVPSNYVKRLKQGLFSSLRSTLRRKGRSKSTSSHENAVTDSPTGTGKTSDFSIPTAAFLPSRSLNRADVNVVPSILPNSSIPSGSKMGAPAAHWPLYFADHPLASSSSGGNCQPPPNNLPASSPGGSCRVLYNGSHNLPTYTTTVSSSDNFPIVPTSVASNTSNSSTANNYYNLPFPAAALMRLSPNDEENEFCVAKFPYRAVQLDELHLQTGQRLKVLERSPDGWWRGVSLTTNQCGWFPSNYVILEKRVRHFQQQQQQQQKQSQTAQLSSTSKPPSVSPNNHYYCNTNNSQRAPQYSQLYQTSPYGSNHANNSVVSLSPRIRLQGASGNVGCPASSSNPSPSMQSPPALQQPPFRIMAQTNQLNGLNITPNEGQHPDMACKPWYWGTLSRLEAEIILRRQSGIDVQHPVLQNMAKESTSLPLPPDRDPTAINSGRFLVRDCESEPGNLALTMCAREKVRNFRVQRLHDETSSTCDEAGRGSGTMKFHIGHKVFPSMEALIAYYQHKPIHICEQEKFYLTQPVVKPA